MAVDGLGDASSADVSLEANGGCSHSSTKREERPQPWSATLNHKHNLHTPPHPPDSAEQFSHQEIAMSADAIWLLTERLAGEHIAQLYSSDTVLIESLRIFAMHGLSRREAVFLF